MDHCQSMFAACMLFSIYAPKDAIGIKLWIKRYCFVLLLTQHSHYVIIISTHMIGARCALSHLPHELMSDNTSRCSS